MLSIIDDDIAHAMAKAYFKLYSHLKLQGFTEEQAMQICSNLDLSLKGTQW